MHQVGKIVTQPWLAGNESLANVMVKADGTVLRWHVLCEIVVPLWIRAVPSSHVGFHIDSHVHVLDVFWLLHEQHKIKFTRQTRPLEHVFCQRPDGLGVLKILRAPVGALPRPHGALDAHHVKNLVAALHGGPRIHRGRDGCLRYAQRAREAKVPLQIFWRHGAKHELRSMLQDTWMRAAGPFVGTRGLVATVHAHFDFGTFEAMGVRVVWMKDKMHRNEVDVVDGRLMEYARPVVAVLQAVHVGGDVGLPRQAALVEALLVDMQALSRDIGVVGRMPGGRSASLGGRIRLWVLRLFLLVAAVSLEALNKRVHRKWHVGRR